MFLSYCKISDTNCCLNSVYGSNLACYLTLETLGNLFPQFLQTISTFQVYSVHLKETFIILLSVTKIESVMIPVCFPERHSSV